MKSVRDMSGTLADQTGPVVSGGRRTVLVEGDSLAFQFSAAAVHRRDSVNIHDAERNRLYLIVRPAEGRVVINDQDGEAWGAEEYLVLPPERLAGGVVITAVFSSGGVRILVEDAEPLVLGERFGLLGPCILYQPPTIGLERAEPERLGAAEMVPADAPDEEEVPVAQAGFVDFLAEIPDLGCVVLDGWVHGPGSGESEARVELVFAGARVTGRASLVWHRRDDLGEIGTGCLMLLPGELPQGDATPSLRHADLFPDRGDACRLMPSIGVTLGSERTATHLMRDALARARAGDVAHLRSILRRPLYEGLDTLAPMNLPVHVEIDEVVDIRPGAVLLFGWRLDPQDRIASVHLRCGVHASSDLSGAEVRVGRPDIVDAFSPLYGVVPERTGFIALVDTGATRSGPLFLEIRLADGGTAFKPLGLPTRGGMAAIRRLLGETRVPADEIQPVFDRVFGPASVALNRRRLSRLSPVTEMAFGTPPASPRASLVIPLYGRLDFLRCQLALFSAGGLETDEILYVLDEPSRKGELLEMAQAAHDSFQVPFRVIVPGENRGFGPASNLGLERARGRYVCFLNSDVFPITTDFFDRLAGDLEADPALGTVGGLLLLADGSIQHAGMTFERIPAFANWWFPKHPAKGRLPPAVMTPLVKAPAITGACMMLATDLARDLGGFDPDYVIGDFEDADLCRRIAARGLGCAVDTRARAYHLERQSQGRSTDPWRHNLTLLNAWIFNLRHDRAARGNGAAAGADRSGSVAKVSR